MALIPNCYDANQAQANVERLAEDESWITVQIRLAGRHPSLPYLPENPLFVFFGHWVRSLCSSQYGTRYRGDALGRRFIYHGGKISNSR